MTRFFLTFQLTCHIPTVHPYIFHLSFFFFSCIDSQSQGSWSPNIRGPLIYIYIYIHSHSQNNSLQHPQLVFYFIFTINIAKYKFDFFMVDLNSRKIRESTPKKSRKIDNEDLTFRVTS